MILSLYEGIHSNDITFKLDKMLESEFILLYYYFSHEENSEIIIEKARERLVEQRVKGEEELKEVQANVDLEELEI